MKRKWPIVEVEWVDSMGFDGWQSPDDILSNVSKPNAMMQYTCGYLFKRDKKFVVVAGSHSDTDSSRNINNIMQIPRSAIRSLRILKEKE